VSQIFQNNRFLIVKKLLVTDVTEGNKIWDLILQLKVDWWLNQNIHIVEFKRNVLKKQGHIKFQSMQESKEDLKYNKPFEKAQLQLLFMLMRDSSFMKKVFLTSA